MEGVGQNDLRVQTSTGASPSCADFFCRWPEISGLAKKDEASQGFEHISALAGDAQVFENTSNHNGLCRRHSFSGNAEPAKVTMRDGFGVYICQADLGEVRHG